MGGFYNEIGADQRPHTEACRERIEKLLQDDRVLWELERLQEQQDLARRSAEPTLASERNEENEDEEMECKDSDAESEGEDEEMVLNKGDIMRVSYDEEREEKLIEVSKQAGRRGTSWKSDVKTMSEALKRENLGVAIIENCPPPRISAMAELWKLLSGWSVGLTAIDPDDNRPRD